MVGVPGYVAEMIYLQVGEDPTPEVRVSSSLHLVSTVPSCHTNTLRFLPHNPPLIASLKLILTASCGTIPLLIIASFNLYTTYVIDIFNFCWGEIFQFLMKRLALYIRVCRCLYKMFRLHKKYSSSRTIFYFNYWIIWLL